MVEVVFLWPDLIWQKRAQSKMVQTLSDSCWRRRLSNHRFFTLSTWHRESINQNAHAGVWPQWWVQEKRSSICCSRCTPVHSYVKRRFKLKANISGVSQFAAVEIHCLWHLEQNQVVQKSVSSRQRMFSLCQFWSSRENIRIVLFRRSWAFWKFLDSTNHKKTPRCQGECPGETLRWELIQYSYALRKSFWPACQAVCARNVTTVS